MRKFRFAALILVVFVIFACIFLLTPKRLKGTLACTSLDGEMAEVDYDIRYFGRRILPSYVKGTISVNGISYVDQYTKLERVHTSASIIIAKKIKPLKITSSLS